MILLEADIGSGVYGPVIGGIVSLGFAVWFGYYVTTTMLPKRDKDFTEAIDKISLRDNDNMRQFWSERREDAKEHRDAIKELAAEIRASNELKRGT